MIPRAIQPRLERRCKDGLPGNRQRSFVTIQEMEFESSDLFEQVAVTSNGIQVSAWDGASIDALSRPQQVRLAAIVDNFGRLSAKAQGLSTPVTDFARTRLNGHVLYLASTVFGSKTQILGGLKIGCKRLFLHSPHSSKYLEMSPDCVLDFYVHESCQRSGIGRSLLETFLQESGKTAAMLAYDRPSPKLKAFLAKHYGLVAFQPQSNNYVVFNEFFQTEAAKQKSTPRKVLQVEAIASQLALGSRSASSPAALSPPDKQAATQSAPLRAGAQPTARPASPAMDIAPPSRLPSAPTLQRRLFPDTGLPATSSSLPAPGTADGVYKGVTPPIGRSPPAAAGSAPVRPAGISQGPPFSGSWRMPAAATLARGLSTVPAAQVQRPADASAAKPPAAVTTSATAPARRTASGAAGQMRAQACAGAGTNELVTHQSGGKSPAATPSQQQTQQQRPQPQAGGTPTLVRPPLPSLVTPTTSESGGSTPVGSPLRTPWALHDVEDAKDIVARLQPAARRTDLLRSPARSPLQPFQLRGPVATR